MTEKLKKIDMKCNFKCNVAENHNIIFRFISGVMPIISPPQLSGQITYSPPNHGNCTIMGGYIFMAVL